MAADYHAYKLITFLVEGLNLSSSVILLTVMRRSLGSKIVVNNNNNNSVLQTFWFVKGIQFACSVMSLILDDFPINRKHNNNNYYNNTIIIINTHLVILFIDLILFKFYRQKYL